MKKHLITQFHLLQAIRDFFLEQDFLDVLTPPMVQNPGMETHIHPFQLKSVQANQNIDWYLHTSPEFHMKELLSLGFEKTFTLSYCFRDEPETRHHRPQFIMLEWYRSGEHYHKIMDDTKNLIPYCSKYLRDRGHKMNARNSQFERYSIAEIFLEYLKIDILDFVDTNELKKLITSNYKDIHIPDNQELSWDDYYFLLFLNKIEPHLVNHPNLILYQYPAPLSALSTIDKNNPKVCERFELYLDGVEVANCFNELTDIEEQKKRFQLQGDEKHHLYGYKLPPAEILYQSLERGLPNSCGIALGVERLLSILAKVETPFWK